MSCSVKISSGKSWSGSQRRISSLAEENTCPSPNSGAVPSCALSQTIQTTNNVLVVSSLPINYNTTTTTTTTNNNNNNNNNTTNTGNLDNTVNVNPSITSTVTTTGIITGGGPIGYNTTVASSNIAGVFGAGGTAVGSIPQRIPTPRPVKSIISKKGEDTSKLLKYIDDNVIGKNGTFFGPFGRRKGQ
ncbi:hypothetical protein M0802_007280 [Mischocyttarus mexicanus]|nr:hypothetical protein M0802_007280 [Mischocyttarus mexicanus]